MLKNGVSITYTTARLLKRVTKILLQGYANVIKNNTSFTKLQWKIKSKRQLKL